MPPKRRYHPHAQDRLWTQQEDKHMAPNGLCKFVVRQVKGLNALLTRPTTSKQGFLSRTISWNFNSSTGNNVARAQVIYHYTITIITNFYPPITLRVFLPNQLHSSHVFSIIFVCLCVSVSLFGHHVIAPNVFSCLPNAGTTRMPKIGYGSNKKTKHMAPNGFYKFVVRQVKGLHALLTDDK